MYPYLILHNRWIPKYWRADYIGPRLCELTDRLGFTPIQDPAHRHQTKAPWYSIPRCAYVRRRTVRNPRAASWHQDGDLVEGSLMNDALILWTNRTPTEFRVEGKVYVPKPFQVILFNNLDGEHRRPPDAPRRRWLFRQRVEVEPCTP